VAHVRRQTDVSIQDDNIKLTEFAQRGKRFLTKLMESVSFLSSMKTALLLSGGVDSSVALNLLVRQGRSPTAFYLKIWLEDELSFLGSCPWEEDLSYARAVCERLKVPLEVIPLQREYHELVVGYAIAELKKGGTPSPDLFCNRLVKYGAFLQKAGVNFDRIATGHYAVIQHHQGQALMLRNRDPIKDQTYFLSRMNQDQVQKAEFPLGPYTKKEVRALAQEWNLPNKDRPDSQGICFLGKIPYKKFVEHYLGTNPGYILNAKSGQILGRHRGLWFYTLGQRSGLGLSGGPWYVCGKNVDENLLLLSHFQDLVLAQRDAMLVEDLHWLGEAAEDGNFLVKVRHGPQLYEARMEYLTPERFGPKSRALVRLKGYDTGLAAGQYCVFYCGEQCLGSARIAGFPSEG